MNMHFMLEIFISLDTNVNSKLWVQIISEDLTIYFHSILKVPRALRYGMHTVQLAPTLFCTSIKKTQ